MKNINLTFLLAVFCLLSVATNGAPGDLDPTFGTGGVAAISFDFFSNDRAGAVAVQPDGKIVVAGSAQIGSPGYDFAVARLNADGSLDASFGTGGKAKIPVSAANDFLSDMVLQPDGKIVLVGSGFNQPNSDVAVARLNNGGTLDTTFNGTGKIVVPVGAGAANDFASEVILQPDGKIVVAGGDGSDFALLRFNPNGSFDASFDGDGKVTTAIGTQRDEARTVALQADGKIVAGGLANSGTGNRAALVRYNANGSLDATFDGDGKLVVEIRPNETEVFKSIIIQADGRIIAVGAGGDETSRGDFLLARFNSDGSFDASFGAGGRVITRVGTGDNAAYTAVAQPDGKVVAAGIAARGAISGFAVVRYLIDATTAQRSKAFDFDGDGKADVSVYRPSEGAWFIQGSQSGFIGNRFGISTDRIVPADYDGDGKTDIAVYRPSEGAWYILNSGTGAFTGVRFGSSEDIPAPSDYDGDGRAELGIYRPSEGNWYMFNLTNNSVTGARFGLSGDIPVAADYDGDGKADVALFRPSEGNWYIQQSRDGFFGTKWGVSSDKPVVGDYDGDGKADFAVYRPAESSWYILKSKDGFSGVRFGIATDLPAAADYDGDGKTDIAVFRPSDGDWYLLKSRDGLSSTHFGSQGDKPAPNSFVP